MSNCRCTNVRFTSNECSRKLMRKANCCRSPWHNAQCFIRDRNKQLNAVIVSAVGSKRRAGCKSTERNWKSQSENRYDHRPKVHSQQLNTHIINRIWFGKHFLAAADVFQLRIKFIITRSIFIYLFFSLFASLFFAAHEIRISWSCSWCLATLGHVCFFSIVFFFRESESHVQAQQRMAKNICIIYVMHWCLAAAATASEGIQL